MWRTPTVIAALLFAEVAALRLPSRFTQAQETCISQYVASVNHTLPGFEALLRLRRWGGRCTPKRGAGEKRFINAGQGTTATKSLDCLFQQMGFRQHHWTLSDAPAAFWRSLVTSDMKGPTDGHCMSALNGLDFGAPLELYDLIGDHPVGTHFLDFYACRPDAKVLLTTRPSAKWVPARLDHYTESEVPMESPCGLKLKDAPTGVGAALFDAHDDLVRCIVPKQDLFEVDVFTKSATGLSSQIAQFAGKSKAAFDMTYPHVSEHDDDACYHTLRAQNEPTWYATPKPSWS